MSEEKTVYPVGAQEPEADRDWGDIWKIATAAAILVGLFLSTAAGCAALRVWEDNELSESINLRQCSRLTLPPGGVMQLPETQIHMNPPQPAVDL